MWHIRISVFIAIALITQHLSPIHSSHFCRSQMKESYRLGHFISFEKMFVLYKIQHSSNQGGNFFLLLIFRSKVNNHLKIVNESKSFSSWDCITFLVSEIASDIHSPLYILDSWNVTRSYKENIFTLLTNTTQLLFPSH